MKKILFLSFLTLALGPSSAVLAKTTVQKNLELYNYWRHNPKDQEAAEHYSAAIVKIALSKEDCQGIVPLTPIDDKRGGYELGFMVDENCALPSLTQANVLLIDQARGIKRASYANVAIKDLDIKLNRFHDGSKAEAEEMAARIMTQINENDESCEAVITGARIWDHKELMGDLIYNASCKLPLVNAGLVEVE